MHPLIMKAKVEAEVAVLYYRQEYPNISRNILEDIALRACRCDPMSYDSLTVRTGMPKPPWRRAGGPL